jgi:hypothetical protein
MHLAEHFKRRRQEMGLSMAQLARTVGYRNVSKGVRRIAAFEEAGLDGVGSAVYERSRRTRP